MRHRQRHVHHTILAHVRAALTDAGWINAPINWNQPAVTLMEYEPQKAGETPAFNSVAVSIGHQGSNDEAELGGLLECRYTVFVDIYPTTESVGVAIGEDIKDSLDDEIITLLDFTTASAGAPTDARIEFTDVEVEPLQSTAAGLDKRSWRAVKATAVCYFL